jgi:hypothetical protein
VKYGRLWNEKTLSTLAKEDQDIHSLINVYHSLKKEEQEVMKRIKQVARNRKETTLLTRIPVRTKVRSKI